MLWNVQEANGLPITIRGKRPLALYSAKFLPGERNEAGPSNKRWEQTKEDLFCPTAHTGFIREYQKSDPTANMMIMRMRTVIPTANISGMSSTCQVLG